MDTDRPTQGALGALLLMGLMFMLLAALLPRPVPCDTYKTNVSEVNSSLTVGGKKIQLPVICFGSPDRNISLSVKGGFFELYDFNGLIPTFTFGNNISNTTISNATIYRHKCQELHVIRQSGIRMCSSATMDIPYLPPTSSHPVVTNMNLTVINCDPCKKFNATRLVHVIWEEMLDLHVTSITPNLICNKQPQKLVIKGKDFVQIYVKKTKMTYPPTLLFNGLSLVNVTINPKSCHNYTASNVTVSTCTEMAAILPEFQILTDDDLHVHNPLPCMTSEFTVPNAIVTYAC